MKWRRGSASPCSSCASTRRDSDINRPSDVDREHVRVGVKSGSAYDLFLSRTLQRAQVVRGEEGTDIFTQLGLEAAAGIRQPMATFVAQNASLRLIEERFMEIRQALGVSRTRTPEAIRFLSATIEELKASGFVRDALRGPGRSQPRSGRHVAQGWHLLDGGPLGG